MISDTSRLGEFYCARVYFCVIRAARYYFVMPRRYVSAALERLSILVPSVVKLFTTLPKFSTTTICFLLYSVSLYMSPLYTAPTPLFDFWLFAYSNIVFCDMYQNTYM